jgi:primosomal protein N'
MLWQHRVHSMVVDLDRVKSGMRCRRCGGLTPEGRACPECGGSLAPVPDVFTEAVRQAMDQSAHVRLSTPQAVSDEAGGIAALGRY